MKRRKMIALFGGTILAWPLDGHGQQPGRTYRLGFLYPDPRNAPQHVALFDELGPRCAEPIRASSPPGLHQQAGHMTASDTCTTRYTTSCTPGAIHT